MLTTETVKQGLADLKELVQHEPMQSFEITTETMFAVLGSLQLVIRSSKSRSLPVSPLMENFARQLARRLSASDALAAVMQEGFENPLPNIQEN